MAHKTIGLVLALALADPGSPALAQTQPAPDELVDRLLAALPDQERLRHPPDLPHAAPEEASLRALNPGREAEVSAVMRDFRNCIAPEITAGTLRAMRSVIRPLGTRKVELLLRFYSGPDFQRMMALIPRGNSRTDAQERELAQLMQTYPLEEFATRLNDIQQVASQDQVMRTRTRQCAADKAAALDRQRLRR